MPRELRGETEPPPVAARRGTLCPMLATCSFPTRASATVCLRLAVLVVVVLEGGCRSTSPGGCGGGKLVATQTGVAPMPSPSASRRFGGDRPAWVIGTEGVAPAVLLALHGYGDTGANFVNALALPALARREGFVLVVPDGTPDRRGYRFWNATDACCNFFEDAVDDVAYLRGLLAEAAAAYRVDRRRRYVLGLSNGAFMASRLACEAADEIAAIVPISGTTWDDPGRCRPGSPVSVLQIHADSDRIILYGGGRHVLGIGRGAYPGAVATVERWARLDACSGTRVPIAPLLDLDHEPGAETMVEYVAGCPPGVDVRLLTMRGAPHVPALATAFGDWVWGWLKAHPKVAGPERTSGPP
jgi:polyhydroxybutyrate depolymerase